MLRRFFYSALLMMFAFWLGGCGNEQSVTNTRGTSGDPTEISWYFIGNGQQEDVAKIEAAAGEYLQKTKHLNVKLKLQCFDWGSYDQKLRTMIAARENFDICFTSSWTNNYQQGAIKGAFIPLNDLLDKYAPKTKRLIGEDFLKGSRIDGINYAIPANKEKAHQWGFIIRKDLIDKYKMDISSIKQLEDIEPLLDLIKRNEPEVYPLEALNGESPFKLLDFDRVGDDRIPGVVWNDSKDMKVFNELEAPETRALFEVMHSFFQKGYIRKDAATIRDFNADENAGKIFAAVKSLKPGKAAEMTIQTGWPWIQVEITPPIISNRDTTGSMQAISTTSKHPELALQVLEVFNTDIYLNNLINFGIKDVHYTFVKDGIIAPGPESAKYNPATGWMFGNQFINYLFENENPGKWNKFKAFNEKAIGTKTLGFIFDPGKVKTEMANCINIWDQYVPALETGTVDPEKFLPEAIAAFKDAGADRIIAEKQRQLDEWLNKQ